MALPDLTFLMHGIDMSVELSKIVDAAWDDRASLSSATKGPVRDAVLTALAELDAGRLRVAEKTGHANNPAPKPVWQ